MRMAILKDLSRRELLFLITNVVKFVTSRERDYTINLKHLSDYDVIFSRPITEISSKIAQF